MRDHQIGGLPVVEGPTKTIVGNLSIRDIRYLLLKPEIFSNFGALVVFDARSSNMPAILFAADPHSAQICISVSLKQSASHLSADCKSS
ncbi:hypothetical protein KIW84_057318 [Lathyrus oleraceus]|uniref:Uncharacterized protein n=1 Tax=Pisum sativum TaxID=3888 RepID=A0A9D5AI01_PEA|nr:hypothetical protein KIW84_057318 [Pisum sativum]